MKKIALILPYFGKFPPWMNLYLKSCANNPSIEYLIFTDDLTKWNYPDNVKVYYCSIQQCQNRIEDKLGVTFGFKISPYKLVDFKVAYGVIFEDYISAGGYEYWGFCDCDVIWGDIRKFISDAVLDRYDKVGIHGHLEIFKNDYIFNRLFLLGTESIPYERLLMDNNISWYDEYNGIATIYNKLGIQQYTIREKLADIYPDKTEGHFVDISPNNNVRYQAYKYSKGKLYRLTLNRHKKCVKQKELMYMHFQKCKLPVRCDEQIEEFYITSKGFVNSLDEVSLITLDSHTYYERNFFVKILNLLKIFYWRTNREIKCFLNRKFKSRIF